MPKTCVLKRFFYKNQRFWCENLFIYRALHTILLSLFLLRSFHRSSYTLFIILYIIGCLIYSHAKLLLFFEKTSIFAIFYQNSADFGVLGNGITSRIFCIPVTKRINRSKPSPKPAWGHDPQRRVSIDHHKWVWSI